MTLEEHKARWEKCVICPIGCFAFRKVMYETFKTETDAVDILFIGEGPGEAENALGRPFIGISGQLLREAIGSVNTNGISYAFTNVVACRPQDKAGGKNRQPNDLEISSCNMRLRELIHITQPKVIVAVGAISKSLLSDMNLRIPLFHILHPAYILRQGGTKYTGYEQYKQSISRIFENMEKRHAKEMESV